MFTSFKDDLFLKLKCHHFLLRLNFKEDGNQILALNLKCFCPGFVVMHMVVLVVFVQISCELPCNWDSGKMFGKEIEKKKDFVLCLVTSMEQKKL